MPTAIVRIYTPDGFVVGADGLVRNSATGAIVRDDLQKIHRFGNSPLIFSFVGGARLGRADRDDTEDVLFDFIASFSSAVETISAARCRTLQEYAGRLTKSVNRGLEEALHRGNISLPDLPSADPSERGRTIVVVFIDGYHAGLPDRVRIRFCQENQKLLPPEVTPQTLTENMPIVHGIPEIGKRIISNDPSLRHYMLAVEVDDSYSADLATAIAFSRAFIAACAGPEGAEIDSAISSNIGGRIHIATITPKEGFRWVPKFEPAPQ